MLGKTVVHLLEVQGLHPYQNSDSAHESSPFRYVTAVYRKLAFVTIVSSLVVLGFKHSAVAEKTQFSLKTILSI